MHRRHPFSSKNEFEINTDVCYFFALQSEPTAKCDLAVLDFEIWPFQNRHLEPKGPVQLSQWQK